MAMAVAKNLDWIPITSNSIDQLKTKSIIEYCAGRMRVIPACGIIAFALYSKYAMDS